MLLTSDVCYTVQEGTGETLMWIALHVSEVFVKSGRNEALAYWLNVCLPTLPRSSPQHIFLTRSLSISKRIRKSHTHIYILTFINTNDCRSQQQPAYIIDFSDLPVQKPGKSLFSSFVRTEQ